ncbi:hypothetical protein [Gluconobacter kanchanaburiensis]|uniref:hypothetical protein n=1 Tax=Gluconobacter kanchanaburiensis TaxID=563199 RepID=UPI0011BF9885|nr:hypothetical protein [Gluconobacter kanchanaburiensis]MBF0862692.1 hypothetical protein [Gluconobacter kanchanaburiensis]
MSPEPKGPQFGYWFAPRNFSEEFSGGVRGGGGGRHPSGGGSGRPLLSIGGGRLPSLSIPGGGL